MNILKRLFTKDNSTLKAFKNNPFMNAVRNRILSSREVILDYVYIEYVADNVLYCFVLDEGYVIKLEDMPKEPNIKVTAKDVEIVYNQMLELLQTLKQENEYYV